jgi:hypothetical protein
VKWSINHEDRLVLASAEGEASMAELEQYVSEMIAAGGLPTASCSMRPRSRRAHCALPN